MSFKPLPSGASHESPSTSTQPVYRDAQAVRYGDLLFVSGKADGSRVARERRDRRRSSESEPPWTMSCPSSKAAACLSATSCRSPTMQNIAELPKADAVYESYFRRGLPARSVVGVNGMPNGSLVEITVIAGK